MIVKICGIKSIETLFCCENNRVNYFGMIFYEKSPRNISYEDAKILQGNSKKLKIEGVGVFVNKELKDIQKHINDLDLKIIQLHGDEDNEYINHLKKLKMKVIKKISIRDNADLKKLNKYSKADFFLFDYKPEVNELPGGNAKSFDWDVLKNLRTNKPWFLSGGVNITNIKYIKSKINPFGVDLSSSLEKELGIKDNQIINNFMDEIYNA